MAREGARSKDSAKPGIKEVAAVAGVSPTTVSRVLNNRGYINVLAASRLRNVCETKCSRPCRVSCVVVL